MGQAYDYWQDQPGILQAAYSKASAQLEEVFTWDTHKTFQLQCALLPEFYTHFPQARPETSFQTHLNSTRHFWQEQQVYSQVYCIH